MTENYLKLKNQNLGKYFGKFELKGCGLKSKYAKEIEIFLLNLRKCTRVYLVDNETGEEYEITENGPDYDLFKVDPRFDTIDLSLCKTYDEEITRKITKKNLSLEEFRRSDNSFFSVKHKQLFEEVDKDVAELIFYILERDREKLFQNLLCIKTPEMVFNNFERNLYKNIEGFFKYMGYDFIDIPESLDVGKVMSLPFVYGTKILLIPETYELLHYIFKDKPKDLERVLNAIDKKAKDEKINK